MVSIAPYANKIKEIDLKMCSICTTETKNNGNIPIDLKYLGDYTGSTEGQAAGSLDDWD